MTKIKTEENAVQNNRQNKEKKKENLKVSTNSYKGVRDFYPED
jgi:hypothetical protein